MSGAWALWLLPSFLVLPLLVSALEMVAAVRASGRATTAVDVPVLDDFEVLVPVYGAIRYLENVDYLSAYGGRVLLCTTTRETPEFDAALDAVATRHGFRVFRGAVDRAPTTGRRATGGTTRDRLVRDATRTVRAAYVVCLDADTTTTRPLGELVGAMAAADLDLVSVRLVPSNGGTWLARLQRHEYHVAMMLRRLMPWMVSGACHAARASVHREVMDRHSLFFQGNDIEVGLLAEALGYRVGHLPFEVPTTVPETVGPWLRQRLAWSGGEARLFLANPQLALRHPFFWSYGALLVILATPLRWQAVDSTGTAVLAVVGVYLLTLLFLHRGRTDRYVLLMPFYAAFSSLVLTPLGLLSYVRMASADRNLGLIRLHRQRA